MIGDVIDCADQCATLPTAPVGIARAPMRLVNGKAVADAGIRIGEAAIAEEVLRDTGAGIEERSTAAA